MSLIHEHFRTLKKKISKKTHIDRFVEKAIQLNASSRKVIVFPEIDSVILKACSQILREGIAIPLIIGERAEVTALLHKMGIHNLKDQHILDHLEDKNKFQLETYAKEFFDMRKADGKDMTLDEARDLMTKPHYYGAMLVHKGVADGMISGIHGQTKPYYPAFQIIKTRKGIPRASGLMIMQREEELFFFADIALNQNPTSEELAGIALTTAETALNLGVEPKVAMLSFSTHGSSKHELVDKVRNATEIIKNKSPDLLIDGEIQLDAAIVPAVAERKCRDSVIHGKANTLIFPDLNAGNIGYKLVERFAGFRAVGPIMQGLNKPINDLSHGSSVEEVVELAAITVIQSTWRK
ncbi:MAG TPA: phosphate acetyltransferase [Alphaproteobacteria bacterium]|nr:phosphate acetyltransferase [Alphaproteobacteria bacterium]